MDMYLYETLKLILESDFPREVKERALINLCLAMRS